MITMSILVTFRHLYLRELCDESLTRCGMRDIRNPFFVGPFHDVGGNEIRQEICGVKYAVASSLDRGSNESRP